MYESLKTDLKKLEEVTRGTNAGGATVPEVCGELCSFIGIRIQLIDLWVLFIHRNRFDFSEFSITSSYEKMYNMSVNGKIMHHRELLQNIEAIVQNHYLLCSHITLTAIKAALT